MNLVPPLSKSDAQRALVIADLLGVPFADVLPPNELLPTDVQVLHDGLLALRTQASAIDCRDGGAPFRFLLAQAAVLPGRLVEFRGTERLGERPHGPLVAALRDSLADRGLRIKEGQPWPLVLQSPAQLRGPFSFRVTGAQSSQYASALLLASARLARESGEVVSLGIAGERVSELYFRLTRDWLERTGFHVAGDDTELWISAPRSPQALPSIPGDWSSIGYLLAFSWVSGLAVERLRFSSGHPDEQLVGVLAGVGLALEEGRLLGVASRGFEVDARQLPDAIPTLAAIATRLPVPSSFTHTGILTVKESDRRAAVVRLLTGAGVKALVDGETLVVHPGAPTRGIVFDAEDDHRMAMTAAVLAALHEQSLTLRGARSVAKSFPRFWDEAAKVGVRPEELD